MRTLILSTIICFAFLQTMFSQTEVWRINNNGFGDFIPDGYGNVYGFQYPSDSIMKINGQGTILWQTESVIYPQIFFCPTGQIGRAHV